MSRSWLSGFFGGGDPGTRAAWTSAYYAPQVWTSFQDYENSWTQKADSIRRKQSLYLPATFDGSTMNVLTLGLILSGTGPHSQAQNPTALKAAAGGADVSGWAEIAQAINDNSMDAPSTVLRIGHEASGNWYPWATNCESDLEAAYRGAWAHAHDAIAAACPHVRFDLCLNTGRGGVPAIGGHYPGDDYIDIISLDIYDYGTPATTAALFLKMQNGEGFAEVGAFADDHGKKFAIDEWGVGTQDDQSKRDNPFFVSSIFSSLAGLDQRYPGIVSHDSYFNSANNHNLSRNPKSAAQYQSLWKTYVPTPAPSYAVTGLVRGRAASFGIAGSYPS